MVLPFAFLPHDSRSGYRQTSKPTCYCQQANPGTSTNFGDTRRLQITRCLPDVELCLSFSSAASRFSALILRFGALFIMGSFISRLFRRKATAPPMASPEATQATPAPYCFPQDKLRRRLKQPNKTPLVLVACGSFSPITTLHLQLFELAERYLESEGTQFEVVGNYMSPCSDTYGKSSLVPSHHRIAM